MLRGGDIKEGQITGNLPLVSQEIHIQYKRTTLQKNDIVIALVGYPGEAAIIPENLIGANISRAVGLLRLNEKLDPRFLVLYLNSPQGRATVLKPSAGSAQIVVNLRALNNLQLVLPGIPEQQKIADCLTSLDEVITAEAQKLAALKAHKKGLMQQLFPAEGETVPELRFPEFREKQAWHAHTIGDFIESSKAGASLTPKDFVPMSNYEVIPKKAISEGGWLKIEIENQVYCTEDFFNENPQSIVDCTYLITTLRDLVPSGPSIGYIVKFKGDKQYVLAQGVYGLKPKDEFVSDFLVQFSNTIQYRKLVNAIMVGSTQVHIRNGEFLDIPLHVPSTKEQQKIADCLTSLDELIAAQAEKIEALKAQKKGLLQGLFPLSGL